MKKKLIILSFVIVALVSVGAGIFFLFVRQEPVYIAVAAPLSGANRAEGMAMLKGIELCLDEINQKGGIDGRKIKMRSFNDKGRPRTAAKVASQIAEDRDILLVLGHFDSPSSIAAGRTYRKNGIPAITASASAGPVTSGNEWYFRTISDNAFQGSFIAGYVSKSLNKKSVNVIFSDDSYGMTLVKNFEKTAMDMGLDIKKKWKFQPESSLMNNELKRIAAEIRAMEDPGMIFIAVPEDQAPRIISSLKFPGTDYAIMGPDSFTTESFLREFNKYPQERARPGYFTDDIYAISPFLTDIANEKAEIFRQKFLKKYEDEPSWIAACYYDTAIVAAEAIRKIGVFGKERIRRDRRELRLSLMSINTMEDAVKGVTGYIYFDKNRDARAPFLPVVIYKNQRLFPAYSQYQPGHGIGDDSLKNVLEGEIIVLEEKVMNKTDVVYAGIDVDEISNLDMKRSKYTADFHVWFQYKGNFDPSDIIFLDTVKPVKLGNLVVDRKKDNITFQSYHVKTDFKNDFDFHAYPFDEQYLHIRFRHARRTRDKLIYTPGTSESGKKTTYLDPLIGWGVKDTRFYQDIITMESRDFFDSQNNISYSQFNAEIRIRRNGSDLILRYFLPLAVIVLALFMAYFIPYRRFGTRLWVIMLSLTANSFYHRQLLADIKADYWSIAEYAIFTLYGLISFSVMVSMGISILSRQKKIVKIKQINQAGKIFHVAAVLAAGLGIWLWLGSDTKIHF